MSTQTKANKVTDIVLEYSFVHSQDIAKPRA